MRDHTLSQQTYVVAGCKPWNKEVFDKKIRHLPGEWIYVGQKEKLTVDFLQKIQPRYIFFLHWSWIVPPAIFEQFEAVVFHMTDVPYGRGGSPLQNLIVRGQQQTKLTALQMAAEVDGGPVYFKEDLALGGTAEEVYIRATWLSAEMIARLIEEQPQPQPQQGEPTFFKRRRPHQSEIGQVEELIDLHDFIRMLDAHGYPKAFFIHEGVRFEFSRSALYDGYIKADVKITMVEKDE